MLKTGLDLVRWASLMTVSQGVAAKGGVKSSQVQGSHEDWKTGNGIRA